MNVDKSEPAHPVEVSAYLKGLTKREWFAGQALAGLLANPELVKGWIANGSDIVSEAVPLAFDIADECTG